MSSNLKQSRRKEGPNLNATSKGSHEGIRTCTRCKEEKAVEAFPIRTHASGSRHSMCKPCKYEYEQEWKKNNPEAVLAGELRRRYGITVEQYEAMLRSQRFRCAICQRRDVALVVDHCHKTKRVRGLLCNNCNHAIGKFRDDPEIMRRAIEYVQ